MGDSAALFRKTMSYKWLTDTKLLRLVLKSQDEKIALVYRRTLVDSIQKNEDDMYL